MVVTGKGDVCDQLEDLWGDVRGDVSGAEKIRLDVRLYGLLLL